MGRKIQNESIRSTDLGMLPYESGEMSPDTRLILSVN